MNITVFHDGKVIGEYEDWPIGIGDNRKLLPNNSYFLHTRDWFHWHDNNQNGGDHISKAQVKDTVPKEYLALALLLGVA